MELTIRVEIIILIVIMFFILAGHLFCSCAQVTPFEAFSTVTTIVSEGFRGGFASKESFRGGFVEGMMNAISNNTTVNSGASSNYNAAPVNPSSWGNPNMTYTVGKKLGKGVQNILNRPKQPIPLPKGELFMFNSTEFSPSCCPNTYSNSSGCACMTVDQTNYLSNRGGNNVPYSEY